MTGKTRVVNQISIFIESAETKETKKEKKEKKKPKKRQGIEKEAKVFKLTVLRR